MRHELHRRPFPDYGGNSTDCGMNPTDYGTNSTAPLRITARTPPGHPAKARHCGIPARLEIFLDIKPLDARLREALRALPPFPGSDRAGRGRHKNKPANPNTAQLRGAPSPRPAAGLRERKRSRPPPHSRREKAKTPNPRTYPTPPLKTPGSGGRTKPRQSTQGKCQQRAKHPVCGREYRIRNDRHRRRQGARRRLSSRKAREGRIAGRAPRPGFCSSIVPGIRRAWDAMVEEGRGHPGTPDYECLSDERGGAKGAHPG